MGGDVERTAELHLRNELQSRLFRVDVVAGRVGVEEADLAGGVSLGRSGPRDITRRSMIGA
jgi:hypothetical protein